MRSKKILVTGANGFIGSEVVSQLIGKFDVVAIVSPNSTLNRVNKIKDKIRLIKVDLTIKHEVDELFKEYEPDIVMHLATHGVYSYQQKDIDKIILGNYVMLVNLLQLSKKHQVKKFINTGSVFEYGSRIGRVNEADVDLNDILNAYSAIKIASTALCNAYSQDLNVLTLRPFTTYGPKEDDSRMIKATIRRALDNEPILINKEVIRDFIFVDDVAQAFYLAATVSTTSGEIINVGSGRKYTLESVSRLIKKITKSKSLIIQDNKYIRKKESACYADITKAKQILGWSPKYTLPMGIKKVIYSLS